jgi:flagellin-like hook-associated protein FlgL
MSRWLLNVAQVLEKLDDRAEQAVEEHQQLLEEQQHQQHQMMRVLSGASSASAMGPLRGIEQPTDDSEDPIASILAARGLAVPDDDDDCEDVMEDGIEDSESNEESKCDVMDDKDDDGGGGEERPGGATDIEALSSELEAGGDSTRAAGEGWGELSFTEATASERHDGGNDDDEGAGQVGSTDESQRQTAALDGDEFDASPAHEEGDASIRDDEEDNNRGDVDTTTPPSPDPTGNDPDDMKGENESEAIEPPSDHLVVETEPSEKLNQASSVTATGRRHLLSTPLVASLTGGTPSAAAAAAASLASTALKSWGGGMVSQPARSMSVHESMDDAAAIGSNKSSSGAAESQQVQQLQDLLGQAQKEVRTLRRHVVALNNQLEGAEREVVAQRNELEQAAERMTKDTARHKEERERERTTHQSQVQTLRSEHDAALQAQRAKYEALLEESRSQLKAVEDRRRQEGGNRDKELADALDRESQALAKLASAEDERATLLSQISTLQSQQESLGSRLESLSQTAENAFAREREAEERLDEALSMHARQISQRQAREAELERTVSELGAALVAAEKQGSGRLEAGEADPGNAHGGSASASAALLRVATMESELESLRSQLFDEQQRNHTLEAELRESSRERNEEALVTQKRQQQHDRRIEELNQTLSQLKSELAAARDSASTDNQRRQGSRALERSLDFESMQSQIQSLSDEVVRHRDKLGSAQSEVSALRSRLSAALERAQSAESALEDAQAALAASNRRDDDDDDDVEPGLARMRTRLNRVRQRGGRGGVLGRSHPSNTMRSALKLDGLMVHPHAGGGGPAGAEAIGKTLDAVDSLLSQSGKVLRGNPFARLFFVAYLLLLHVWTFVAILFHAHGMEGIHGDFGGSAQHPMLMIPTPRAAAASANKGNPFPPPQLQLLPKGAIDADANAAAVAGEKVVQVSGP